MPLGEIFLSAFLQVLFDRLSSPELLKYAFREGISSKLNKWERTLKVIEALLIDAEEKQLTDRAVKIWLDDLQDLAYDVEDILDEFTTEASRRKLKVDRNQASTSLVPACFSGLNPCAIKFNMSIGSKIKEITSRLDEIYMRREKLGLREIAGRTSMTAWERPPSTSVPTEPAIYGRDEDKAKVLAMVFNNEPSDDVKIHVIPIVGMGGIGKTTLAREVYNDKAVIGFNPKGWVCVSDESSVLRLSKAILESITCSSCDLNNLDAIHQKLKGAVAGKRFLLVLDDIWKMNYSLWESLKSPLMAGASGSMIIVTTRSSEIASTVAGPHKYHELKTLSDDDCWSLFMKHAFEGRCIDAHRDLELIRQKVIEQCRGLPLAARALGGLLHSKIDDEWEDILDSKVWDLPDDSDILPVLKLSYHYLPAHLKRCFTYCAIFPKDYEFEEKELVPLWMAEGLIQQTRDEQLRSKKQFEDIGSKYFYDLLSRSIFQHSSNHRSKFIMHDLVHDLAVWVSGEICFRLEDEVGTNNQLRRFKRVRHSSYSSRRCDGNDKFEVFNKVEHLRTFLPLSTILFGGARYMPNTIVFDLLPKLKYLRVLCLKDYYITELPNSIGRLRHLRYLDLSNTQIRSLPESTCSLLNLQTLILTDCSRLLMLPSNMRNLINLQYLDISGTIHIREMPVGMKDLKSLLRLSNFIVSKETGSNLKDLRHLRSLRGELCISSLGNMDISQDTRELILSDKEDLEVLILEWGLDFDDPRNEVAEKNVLNMLQPHRNVKELTINGYGGKQFPSWLSDLPFSNMVDLTLENCENCTSLPPLGLLGSLRNLLISGMKNIKSIGFEIFGENCSKPFMSLETLCFENMEDWELWEPTRENEDDEVFPCLLELSVSFCPVLSGRLPDHLPSVEELEISDCEELEISLSSLPMLRKLDVDGCKQLAWTNPTDSKSLKSMSLSNVSIVGNWLRQGFQEVESLKFGECEEFLYLFEMPQGLPSFDSLREICIENCNALTSLPNEIQHKGGLESLIIEDCDSLEYIIRGQPCPSLKKLEIRSCQKLQCLIDDKHVDDISASQSASSPGKKGKNVNTNTTCLLEYLYVEDCPSLKCLSSTGKLPATLTDLHISNCSNLTDLSSGCQFPKALDYLRIDKCAMLESIAERFDNVMSLQTILISNCENLKSIPEGLYTLSNLRDIEIWNCRSLVSFPDRGLPITISEVSIGPCEMLKAFPERMHSLNSLRKLFIHRCPRIMSLPEEGFPTSLSVLRIEHLNKNVCDPLIRWGLNKLTSLKKLNIVGCLDVSSFPPEDMGMILPSSLIELSIASFPNLKYLSSRGFQDLYSLESLTIHDCPNLKSLPGLPHSLLEFCINGCPLVEKRCKRGKGSDWSKIEDFPYVEIDKRFIYDPDEEE